MSVRRERERERERERDKARCTGTYADTQTDTHTHRNKRVSAPTPGASPALNVCKFLLGRQEVCVSALCVFLESIDECAQGRLALAHNLHTDAGVGGRRGGGGGGGEERDRGIRTRGLSRRRKEAGREGVVGAARLCDGCLLGCDAIP